MKFGVVGQVQPEDQRNTEATLARLARAESQGFESVWLAAHDGLGGEAGRSLFAAAALAERTERIRIGVWSTLDPALHPLRLAEDLAVLDIVSGGRLDWAPVGAELTEALEVVATAWCGEPFSHAGERFAFPELVCLPVPEQKPHPRVWLPADGSPQPDAWDPSRCGRWFFPAAAHGDDLLKGLEPRVAILRLEDPNVHAQAAWAESVAEGVAHYDPETLLIWPDADRMSEAEASALQESFAAFSLEGGAERGRP